MMSDALNSLIVIICWVVVILGIGFVIWRIAKVIERINQFIEDDLSKD